MTQKYIDIARLFFETNEVRGYKWGERERGAIWMPRSPPLAGYLEGRPRARSPRAAHHSANIIRDRARSRSSSVYYYTAVAPSLPPTSGSDAECD